MRTLLRNKRPFYAAKFVKMDEQPIIDGDGFDTGEEKPVYAEPVRLFGNISPSRGETETLQFGESLEYDRVISLEDPNADIDEFSRLWLDRTPEDGAHNYIVKAVARSLNSLSVAIKRVDVR